MKCENDLKRNILTFDNPEGFVSLALVEKFTRVL